MIQGPPGSGKTWMSGRLIARLIDAGKRVGVASTSHRAIHKLLAEVEEGAAELAVVFRGVKKASAGNPESEYQGDGIENVFANEHCHDRDLLGGTAWLFADGQHDGKLDYLFIDEAGQVSLADALAMATCARNLVLVGDPQQLGQVLQGSHPDGSEASVLEHLLDGKATIPRRPRDLPREDLPAAPRRLRLHLGGVLRGAPAARPGHVHENDTARHRPALDRRRAQRAPPGLRRRKRRPCGPRSTRWRRPVWRSSEIKVVAPYNAQVDRLRSALPDAVEVGTVDKFQGQQAQVVFYSMASSSGEDVPRGLDFLFSRNRFNVAISRAECLAYLVCSPRLLEVDCRTIDHMRLANALCRFVEVAEAP